MPSLPALVKKASEYIAVLLVGYVCLAYLSPMIQLTLERCSGKAVERVEVRVPVYVDVPKFTPEEIAEARRALSDKSKGPKR
jgi:hypothetical protein